MTGGDLAVQGPRHHVARRQFGIRMKAQHETLAMFVDQGGAFAAQCFGGQRRGIAADGDGSGMELDEFGIGNNGAGTGRHAQSFAARFQRIGGDGIERAQPTGGENDGAGAEQHQPRLPSRAVAGKKPGDAAILHRQFHGMKAFHHPDRRGAQHPFGQGAGNFRPGAIAADMHDAGAGVRRFAAQRQRTVGGAVERRAQGDQIGDAFRGLARHQIDDGGIAQSRAGRDGVGGMVPPVIAFAHRGRDSALGPGAGTGSARTRARQHQRRKRRQFQSGEQTGNAGAQNQRAFGLDHIVDSVGHGIRPSPPACGRWRAGRAPLSRDRPGLRGSWSEANGECLSG